MTNGTKPIFYHHMYMYPVDTSVALFLHLELFHTPILTAKDVHSSMWASTHATVIAQRWDKVLLFQMSTTSTTYLCHIGGMYSLSTLSWEMCCLLVHIDTTYLSNCYDEELHIYVH